jgi:hypothetical protein
MSSRALRRIYDVRRAVTLRVSAGKHARPRDETAADVGHGNDA